MKRLFLRRRLTVANLAAGIIGLAIAIITFVVSTNLQSATAAVVEATTRTEADHRSLRLWQTEAPELLARADKAHKSIAVDCRALSDLNGTLIGIGAALNSGSNKVLAHGDFRNPADPQASPNATLVADTRSAAVTAGQRLTSSASPSPAPTPSTAPITSVDRSDITEVQKELKLRGPYPSVIAAFAALDKLQLPISMTPPAISRSQQVGAAIIDFSTIITLAVPKQNICERVLLTSHPPGTTEVNAGIKS